MPTMFTGECCPQCSGMGTIENEVCNACNGSGDEQKDYSLVPEGMTTFSFSPSDHFDALPAAKRFIEENCLTNEDVKIMKSEEALFVVAKKEIKLLE